MSNYRHSFSFIVSSIIFALIGFSFFLLAQKVEKPKKNRLIPVIKIAIITPPVKKVVEKKKIPHAIVPPIPIHHKAHKKIKHKKKRKIHKKKRIVKKKVAKKKIVKKKIIKKRVIKPKKIKEPIIQEVYTPPKEIEYKETEYRYKEIEEPIIQEVYTPPKEIEYKETEYTYKEIEAPIIQEVYTPPKEIEYKETEYTYKEIEEPMIQEVYTPPTPQYESVIEPVIQAPTEPQRVDKSAEKQQFLSQVRSQIIANKRYPKMALRRHIQGTVKVRFDITASGDVSNIRYINGKSILQKGARRAIEKSFPIDIPNYLRSEFPINDISVSIHFNIH